MPAENRPSGELRPCPFCGGPAEATDATGDHLVSCAQGNACPVYVVAGPYNTAAEAAAAWNRQVGVVPSAPLRICIAGVPRGGKTTLANRAVRTGQFRVGHTDDLIGSLSWSEASAEVATWLDWVGPWVIEGVAVPRALRKWLAANQRGSPADVLIFLSRPQLTLSEGQARMATGCQTVLSEIEDALRARGTTILFI